MNEIIRKAQTGEPTTNGGQFGTIVRPESDAVLRVSPVNDLMPHLRLISGKAGLVGVMPGVLEVIAERESDGDDPGRWMSALGDLDARHVTDGYNSYIGPGVDGVFDHLDSPETEGDAPERQAVEAHILEVTKEAGLPGVMPGVLDAVLDRTMNAPSVRKTLSKLEATDVTRLYEEHIAPVIDELRDDLDDNACRECGERNDDGEGSDGYCGDCADRDSCSECGEDDEDCDCETY